MRLIDADFAEDLLLAHEQNAKAMGKTEYAKGIRTAYADVSALCRTITDAVLVVRCRDCAIRYTSCPMAVRQSDYISFFTKDDDFCSYGTRERDDA